VIEETDFEGVRPLRDRPRSSTLVLVLACVLIALAIVNIAEDGTWPLLGLGVVGATVAVLDWFYSE
jgi:hypothetical protein